MKFFTSLFIFFLYPLLFPPAVFRIYNVVSWNNVTSLGEGWGEVGWTGQLVPDWAGIPTPISRWNDAHVPRLHDWNNYFRNTTCWRSIYLRLVHCCCYQPVENKYGLQEPYSCLKLCNLLWNKTDAYYRKNGCKYRREFVLKKLA